MFYTLNPPPRGCDTPGRVRAAGCGAARRAPNLRRGSRSNTRSSWHCIFGTWLKVCPGHVKVYTLIPKAPHWPLPDRPCGMMDLHPHCWSWCSGHSFKLDKLWLSITWRVCVIVWNIMFQAYLQLWWGQKCELERDHVTFKLKPVYAEAFVLDLFLITAWNSH